MRNDLVEMHYVDIFVMEIEKIDLMGEFGAVYVVSGRITGQTDTMPLRVEKLYQEFDPAAPFAVASLLTGICSSVGLVFISIVVEIAPPQQRGRAAHMLRRRGAPEPVAPREERQRQPAPFDRRFEHVAGRPRRVGDDRDQIRAVAEAPSSLSVVRKLVPA